MVCSDTPQRGLNSYSGSPCHRQPLGFYGRVFVTIVAFVASIGLAIVIALQQLGVVGPWEELRQIAHAFLWEITDLETYYLPWMVAIISAFFSSADSTMDAYSCRDDSRNRLLSLLRLVAHRPYRLAVREPMILGRAWRYILPHIMFPIPMPLIYTPDQAILLMLTSLSMVLLLYKGFRGEASKLSWEQVVFIVIVLWLGNFGGKKIFYWVG